MPDTSVPIKIQLDEESIEKGLDAIRKRTVFDKDFYFAGVRDLPEGTRLYFNGEDWTTRASAAHLTEGWVDAFDVEAAEPGEAAHRISQPSKTRRHHGTVEVR